MRVDCAIGEENLQAESALFLGSDQFLRIAVVGLDVVQVLVVADVKVGFDRVDQRDAGQRAGLGSNQVADLRDVDAGEAVDRRSDAGKFQIEARLFDRGLGGGDRGFASFEGLDFIVILLSADHFFGQQIDGAFGIGLVTNEARHGSFQLARGLVEDGFERARIDLEKKLAFFDQRTVFVILRNEVAADLGHDVGVDQAGKHTDPFADDGNFLLQRCGHRYGEFRHHGLLFFRTAGHEQREQSEQQEQTGTEHRHDGNNETASGAPCTAENGRFIQCGNGSTACFPRGPGLDSCHRADSGDRKARLVFKVRPLFHARSP